MTEVKGFTVYCTPLTQVHYLYFGTSSASSHFDIQSVLQLKELFHHLSHNHTLLLLFFINLHVPIKITAHLKNEAT